MNTEKQAAEATEKSVLYPVGSRVMRTLSQHYGRLGNVIEVKEDRRRIAWNDGGPSTWMNIKFLAEA